MAARWAWDAFEAAAERAAAVASTPMGWGSLAGITLVSASSLLGFFFAGVVLVLIVVVVYALLTGVPNRNDGDREA